MNGLNAAAAMTGTGQNASNNDKVGNMMPGALGSIKMTNMSQNNVELNSLGGEPVNISNLLLGAKNPATSDQINVGCITIIDDDGKYMIDRKLLIDANNSSHQTKARRLFSQSRNTNGQQTTSDFSNLQTKQLSILRNNYRPMAIQNNYILAHDKMNEPFEDYKDDAVLQQESKMIAPENNQQLDQKDGSKSSSLDEKIKMIPQ